MKINLDTRVRVRLTPQGKLVLAYWVRKRDGKLGDYEDLFESDVQELPLWKFISIFGEYTIFSDTQKEYFPDGIEIVEKESE